MYQNWGISKRTGIECSARHGTMKRKNFFLKSLRKVYLNHESFWPSIPNSIMKPSIFRPIISVHSTSSARFFSSACTLPLLCITYQMKALYFFSASIAFFCSSLALNLSFLSPLHLSPLNHSTANSGLKTAVIPAKKAKVGPDPNVSITS